MTSRPPPVPLFQTSLNVISAGVSDFAEDLRRQSVAVIDLDWRPPAGGIGGVVWLS